MKKLQAGDIFLVDSDSFAAKMVKFLMTAPTVWHYIYRAIRGTQQKVRFYHAGICVSENYVAEQQSKVEFETVENAILNKPAYVIYRKRGLTDEEMRNLIDAAFNDLGYKYDWLLIISSFLTWFTGIKQFRSYIQLKNKEFCVTRVGKWYFQVLEETFGVLNWHNLTTDIIDDWCSFYVEDWEVIDSKTKDTPAPEFEDHIKRHMGLILGGSY